MPQPSLFHTTITYKMCSYTPTKSYFTDGSHLLAQANLRDALTVADGINKKYLNDLQMFEMNTRRWFLKTMLKCHPDKAKTDEQREVSTQDFKNLNSLKNILDAMPHLVEQFATFIRLQATPQPQPTPQPQATPQPQPTPQPKAPKKPRAPKNPNRVGDKEKRFKNCFDTYVKKCLENEFTVMTRDGVIKLFDTLVRLCRIRARIHDRDMAALRKVFALMTTRINNVGKAREQFNLGSIGDQDVHILYII